MKWNLECKHFPLRADEREALIMSVHTASAIANHDPMYVRKVDGEGGDGMSEAEHRNAIEMAMVTGLTVIQEALDALYVFLEGTNQLESLEACRAYIIEAMRLKSILQGHEHQILARVAAGSRSDPEMVRRVYQKERARLDKMETPCECPLCCVMSIMDYGAAKSVPPVTDAMKILHEHIKGKSAIDDLINRLK